MSFYTFFWDEPLPVACEGGAVTVGNFDGVHRGHQALLAELRRQADAVGGAAVVLTFDPHPLQLLRPHHLPPLLTTAPQRAKLLQDHGADFVLFLRTTHDLLNLRARTFFETVLRDKLRPRVIVPGFNFHFGHNREGTVDTLREYCRDAGIRFVLVEPLLFNGETISSSRVRAALEAGNVTLASSLLGRPYSITGVVGVGQRRGAKIGFPTANLQQVETMVPGHGVYAVRVHLLHSACNFALYPGAANIGPNPTFGEMAQKIEVHLIGYAGDLYGQRLVVEFIERLRNVCPFTGVAELVAQLHEDVERAKQLVT